MSTHNTDSKNGKNDTEWLSGSGAARFLGFDNHAAIAHMPIPHQRFTGKRGETLMRYRRDDLEAFQAANTYGKK
jgi:streptomycin 6-kinase